jgi:hypothetical protein
VRNPFGTASRPGPGRAARAVWICLLALAGVAGSTAPAATGGTGQLPAGGAGGASVARHDLPRFRAVRTYRGVAAPVRLRIPAVGLDTRLERVGLAQDGTIAAPNGWHLAGWYARGPRPGQAGPAVIVGHVDSRSGPAVFFRLTDLRRGDAVYVDRADGSTARFTVTTRARVPKDRFPGDVVYAPTLEASLHLLTCGGDFDTSTGHYQDNVIVSAVLG